MKPYDLIDLKMAIDQMYHDYIKGNAGKTVLLKLSGTNSIVIIQESDKNKNSFIIEQKKDYNPTIHTEDEIDIESRR